MMMKEEAEEELPVGQRYVRLQDEATKRWVALPRRRVAGMPRVARRNDWYCVRCGRWVDDDDASVVCSNDACEDVYHLACLGLPSLPDGDWFCPGGCKGTPRSSVVAANSDAAAATKGSAAAESIDDGENDGDDDSDSGSDGRAWTALRALRVGERTFARVRCGSLGGRVYYAMNPFAHDALGLAGSAASSLVAHSVGWPDRLRVTARAHPRDYARLRSLGFLGARTAASALLGGSSRVRVLVTADAVRVVLATHPELAACFARFEDALRAESAAGGVEELPEPAALPPAMPVADVADAQGQSAAANKRAEEDEAEAVDAGTVMLGMLEELRRDVGAFKETLDGLQESVADMRRRLEELPPPAKKMKTPADATEKEQQQ